MDATTKQILIADNQRSYAEMLAQRLTNAGGFAVAGIVTAWENAPAACEQFRPDIVALEIGMLGASAFDILRSLSGRLGNRGTVIVSAFWSPFVLHQALQANVCGFLLKQDSLEELIPRLRRIMRGERCFSPVIEPHVQGHPQTGQLTVRNGGRLCELTRWQLKVLQFLVEGHSVKEVARELRLSYKSIDSHKYRIMNKLGIRNRVDLARLAIREGLAAP